MFRGKMAKLMVHTKYKGLSLGPRRPVMHMTPLGINMAHKTNPWSAAWWSVAMPGFGHILLGMYIKGLILLCGEFVFNTIGHINLAILYTFTLLFERAHEVIDYNCALVCAIIFVFGIWDAHRISIAMNRYVWLGSKEEDRSLTFSTITTLGINFMEKRTPWLALFWSMIFPGLGHLYCHRLVSGFTFIITTMIIAVKTRLADLIILTFTAQFERITNVDYQWLLFLPSVYLFSIYDSYSNTVNYNQLFKEEQLYYLLGKYGRNELKFHKFPHVKR
jgi:hypothetical protein